MKRYLPDLTADPEGQHPVARLLGVLLLLALFGLAGLTGVR